MDAFVDVPIGRSGEDVPLVAKQTAGACDALRSKAWATRLSVAALVFCGTLGSAAFSGLGAPAPEAPGALAVDGFGRGDLPAPRGAAVCVTGQVGRLELESKMHRLVAPLAEVHGPVDVLFVLADVEPRYTNSIEGKPEAIVPEFRSHASIVDEVRSSESVANVHWYAFDEPVKPGIPADYVDLLDRKVAWDERVPPRKFLFPPRTSFFRRSPQTVRAQNHARTYYHYSLCGRGLAEMALARGANYETVVRVREDAYAPRSVDVPLIEMTLGDAEERVVVTSACDTWSGVNDKIAFFRPLVAPAYFEGPLEDTFMFWNTTQVKRDVVSSGRLDPLTSDGVSIDPEFILLDAIQRRQGQVVTLGANAFAFAPAHTYRPFDDPDTEVNCLHVKQTSCFCQGGVCDDLKEQGFIVSPTSC